MDKQQEIIILFDGDCLLCNRFIQIPMKYGRVNFLYVSSHSEKGKEICSSIGILTNTEIDTIYLLSKGSRNFESKSNAIIEILRYCNWVHKILASLMVVFPRFIRDYFYDMIAKNRSRSKTNSCKIPLNVDKTKIYL
jgi:predicted DCC family thiol-disulfide oxidoreductase YuxK